MMNRIPMTIEAVTPQTIADNPYRVLGLSGSASQAAITMAARRMRIWPDEKNIPPTPWDLPKIGPLSRSQMALQRAVARLGEPQTRIEDRLLWYAGERPPDEALSPIDADQIASTSAVRHDAVVAILHRAFVDDPKANDVARWRQVLTNLRDWFASAECGEWFVRVEKGGSFDKVATEAEIGAAILSLPQAIASWLTAAALASLDRGDAQACAGMIQMVRSFGSLVDLQSVAHLADRLEDQILEACAQIDAELRPALRPIHTNPLKHAMVNYLAVQPAATDYARRVEPALRQLRALVDDDPSRIGRAVSSAADVLVLIGLGWEWAGRFITAQVALETAAGMTVDLPGHAKIQATLERVRLLADEQRKAMRPSRLIFRASPDRPYVPKAVRKHKPAKAAKKTAAWRYVWILGVVGSALLKGLNSQNEPVRPVNSNLNELQYRQDLAQPFPSHLIKQIAPPAATPAPQSNQDEMFRPSGPPGETNHGK
jgi:hypothetical protein